MSMSEKLYPNNLLNSLKHICPISLVMIDDTSFECNFHTKN